MQPGSGTAFSLLPAENATGNYVKVVQRVPVKIVVDQWPTDVAIGPGMSVVPRGARPVTALADERRGRRTGGVGAPRAKAPGGHNPWLIALVVSLATFMEVLDTTIANVALRYISGGLGGRPGRGGLGGDDLPRRQRHRAHGLELARQALRPQALLHVLHRALHRGLGAVRLRLEPRTRCSSSACSRASAAAAWRRSRSRSWPIRFPPEKRGQAFALYGVAVVVAPVVGPTLGGWLSDNVSWHWCFLINGPVGLLAARPDARAAGGADGRGGGARGAAPRGRALRPASASCSSPPSSGRSRSCSTRASARTGSARRFIVVLRGDLRRRLRAMIPWELTRKNPVVDLRHAGQPPVRRRASS